MGAGRWECSCKPTTWRQTATIFHGQLFRIRGINVPHHQLRRSGGTCNRQNFHPSVSSINSSIIIISSNGGSVALVLHATTPALDCQHMQDEAK